MVVNDSSHLSQLHSFNNLYNNLSVFLLASFSLSLVFTLQEFPLLRLDDVADKRVNIIGFSVFNKTHPFFQDFVLSLNRSWQENCDHAPFAGTPVSTHMITHTRTITQKWLRPR